VECTVDGMGIRTTLMPPECFRGLQVATAKSYVRRLLISRVY
jgi:hypothetical protein